MVSTKLGSKGFEITAGFILVNDPEVTEAGTRCSDIFPGLKVLVAQKREQGWRSDESARLSPMWPGFDSGPVLYVG